MNFITHNTVSKFLLGSFVFAAISCKPVVFEDPDETQPPAQGEQPIDPSPIPLTPPPSPGIQPPQPDPQPATPETRPPQPEPPRPPIKDAKAASRFLVQSTFGPTQDEIDALQKSTLSQWMVDQFNVTPTLHLSRLTAQQKAGIKLKAHVASDSFWASAITGPDQLRQRMAFALSQILVASDDNSSDLRAQPLAMAYYMDLLTEGAFGNYRDLLEDITYSPAMALYLTYMRNEKADPASGRLPDENYAREIMQLFTIGLVELNIDGTPKAGTPETYTNDDVVGLAKVFTGLAEKGGYRRSDADPDGFYAPLQIYPQYHSTDAKSFLGTTIPAGTGAAESIKIALDTLFAHSNVAPFISRQLIQRFVTSDPSPAYVARVAKTFNSGSYTLPDGRRVGDGRRGDLTATLAAILLDGAARQPSDRVASNFGKLREPVLRFTHWARAFNVKNARAGEKIVLRNTSSKLHLAQHPFRAPSVFNFYRPGYIAVGMEKTSTSLNAPEFQIVNESSIVGYINFMASFVRDRTSNINGASGDAFKPNYSKELALADNATELVERIDLLLTYGQMGPVEKQRIIKILDEMPIRDSDKAAEDRELRVHMAVQLAVTSAAYSIQK